MSKGKKVLRTLMPFLALALVYLVFKVLQPARFGAWRNMYLLIQQTLLQTILACGIYFLLSLGIFDLSAGINAIVSAMVGYHLCQYLGWAGLLLGGLATGLLFAFVTGQFMIRLKAPPMIISVGLIILMEAISQNLTMNKTSLKIDTVYRALGHVPLNLIISLSVMAASILIYRYTKLGLYIRAIGSDRLVAGRSGIDVNKYMMIAFLMCGFCASLYGVINLCYSSSVQYASGLASATSVFKPLMACMFANAFKKYLNPIIGVALGLFFLNLISNGLLTNGLESSLQNVIIGFAMILIVRFSSVSRKYDIVK